MEYFKDGYIARRGFDTDSETGLNKEIRAVSLFINSKDKTIIVGYELCLCSSTDAVMKILSFGNYKREGNKFSQLKDSQLGLGIKQMIEELDFSVILDDLSNFPDCLNQKNP